MCNGLTMHLCLMNVNGAYTVRFLLSPHQFEAKRDPATVIKMGPMDPSILQCESSSCCFQYAKISLNMLNIWHVV